MKRGQFFLVAALVIVSILIGLGAIYNSASASPVDSNFFSLINSAKYESIKLADNGYYNNLDQNAIANKIEAFNQYISSSNPNIKMIVLYGKGTNINSAYYTNGNEANPFPSDISITKDTSNSASPTASVNWPYGNIANTFKLAKGYNIYIIGIKEVNNEKFVATA